jgi:uncharacterized phage protein (predicted DNA packaging)
MTLEEAKNYLRVDTDDDDALIRALITAAESYVKQQTGKIKKIVVVDGEPTETDIATDELYNLCVKLLLAHWYENRGVEKASSRNTIAKISHSVDALVNHIAMCGDYV